MAISVHMYEHRMRSVATILACLVRREGERKKKERKTDLACKNGEE